MTGGIARQQTWDVVHVVVLGSGPEVAGLALRLSDDGGCVLVVGALPPADATALARAGVEARVRVTAPALADVLATAEIVIVAGIDDAESTRLARAVVQAGGTAPFPSATLFDERAAARAWQQQGHHAVSRTEALALAALRAVPPWPADRATPPPCVVGDTPLAAEIARRLAVGWQQPGEQLPIHRVVRDRAGAAGSVADVVDEASDPGSVARTIELRCAAWPAPPTTHATVAGPTIYVATDDDPHTLGAVLAARVADARVCVVADAPAQHPAPGVVVVSRREHLADPAVLLLTGEALLADEVFAEASHWPADVPSLFGALARDDAGGVLPLTAQPDAVRRGVAAVAALADDLLRDVGVLLDAPPGPGLETLVPRSSATVGHHSSATVSPRSSATVVLMPGELRAIADRLVAGTPVPDGVDPIEHRQRAIELAARLPALLARAGRLPHRPPGYCDRFVELPAWAPNVHAQYRMTVLRSGGAGHPNGDRDWQDLSPFEQQSNRAQLADIPAKLAAVGLDCRETADPDAPLFAFTEDDVARLAQLEHRRWEQFQRRNGRPDHRFAVPWDDLTEGLRNLDRDAVRAIPHLLRFVGLDIFDPDAVAVAPPGGRPPPRTEDSRVR